MDLSQTPIIEIKGIGEKTAKLFNKLGVYSIRDILLFFPRTYLRFPNEKHVYELEQGGVQPDELYSVKGVINAPAKLVKAKHLDIVTVTLSTISGPVDAVFFNMPYMRSSLNVGESYVFYGRLERKGKRFKMEMPQVFTSENYQVLKVSLQPVYHLTKGLSNNLVRKAVKEALFLLKEEEEVLPDYSIKKNNLIGYVEAIKSIHFPSSYEELDKAHRRLAYQELFSYILSLKALSLDEGYVKSPYKIESKSIVNEVISKLPYELTNGQRDCITAILEDFHLGNVSSRLVQGDVGSGKTLVAFLTMLEVVANGYQAAIMAPTEVLCIQHYETFKSYVKDFKLPYKVALLVGIQSAKERKENQKIIDENESVFIVGTQALLSEKSQFNNLAYVVCDEQHRFGVNQRATLAQKGGLPHSIVMSATPIPRTLALILYGNMSVSVIRDMPKGRLPIKTAVVKPKSRPTSYKFIHDEIEKGHKAYIICPLVEASESTEAENVQDYAIKLKEVFNESAKIEFLHGKMKNSQKNEIMDSFAHGDTDILISTTVVEVGVNVPSATVIMIENANRFGLAALHQLRGRVGRGKDQSFCILIDLSEGNEVSDRLKALSDSTDGFVIAKKDLELRGPGDLLGVRQSGEFGFAVADIISDADLIESASEDVNEYIKLNKLVREELFTNKFNVL